MTRANTGNRILLLVGMLLGATLAQAQSLSKYPLRRVLDHVEERFSVHFGYVDQPIDSLQVAMPPQELTLPQTLRFLEEKTTLEFVQLEDAYISIKPKRQTIAPCGYLIDSENGQPIAEALVMVGGAFTTSDVEGYFELPTQPLPVYGQIKHLSYQPQALHWDGKREGCAQFSLVPSINQLDEVVITNYLTRGIYKQGNGETEAFTQRTNLLPGMTEPDVFFMLQNLPGIHSVQETVTNINIRGGSHDQNLIMWDGLTLYQAGHFFGLISAINPHVAGKTTLIKNGTSAAYGGGVSGTIDVQSRDKQGDNLTAQAGSNLLNTDVLLDMPTPKGHFLLASRQSVGSTLNTPTYQQYFNRAFGFSDVINGPNSQVINSDEKFRFYDVSFHGTYAPSPTTSFSSGFLLLDNAIEYTESAVVDRQVRSKESYLDQGTRAGFLSYEQRWSDRLKTKVYASLMNYTQESLNFDVLTGQEHELDNGVLEGAIKAEAMFYGNETWDLEGGIQLVETGIRHFRRINQPGFRFLSREVMRTLSLYGEGHFRWGSQATLTLGLRNSYFSKLDTFRVEPRLAFHSQLTGPFSVKVLAEMKSQTTVQVVDYETDFLGVENRKWELVNGEDIPLLTSRQASASLAYTQPALLIDVEGFIKQVNGVVTASQGFLNQFQNVRTSGSYLSNGIEVLINPRFDSLDIWLTYTYLNSTYTFAKLEPATFRNNFDITHALSLGATFRWKNLELSSGVNYHSGVPFTPSLGTADPQRDEIVFAAPNTTNLPPYFRVDFSGKYVFHLSKQLYGSCGVALWNLTNRKNVINTFSSVDGNGELYQVNQAALGFTPNVSLRLAYRLGRYR